MGGCAQPGPALKSVGLTASARPASTAGLAGRVRRSASDRSSAAWCAADQGRRSLRGRRAACDRRTCDRPRGRRRSRPRRHRRLGFGARGAAQRRAHRLRTVGADEGCRRGRRRCWSRRTAAGTVEASSSALRIEVAVLSGLLPIAEGFRPAGLRPSSAAWMPSAHRRLTEPSRCAATRWFPGPPIPVPGPPVRGRCRLRRPPVIRRRCSGLATVGSIYPERRDRCRSPTCRRGPSIT